MVLLLSTGRSLPKGKGRKQSRSRPPDLSPKGALFDALTQRDVDLMMSHVNSYGREIFNGVSPARLFVSMYGQAALRLIGQRIILPEEITLRPSLILKN